MSKLFLDANVFLEIMFSRSKVQQVSELMHKPEHEFFASSLTVHILYYFAEAEGVDRSFVERLADLAAHLPIDAKTIRQAQARYTGKDFEDCLQAACAEAGGCDEIVTLDKSFSRLSATKLPVRILR